MVNGVHFFIHSNNLKILKNNQYNLFFDDGGVISDNTKRGAQWQKLVYEYFYPRYNLGTREEWAKANVKAVTNEISTLNKLAKEEPLFDYNKVQREFEIDWIKLMFSEIGIKVPNDDTCIKITRDATHWIARQVQAPYPNIVEAILELSQSYKLYTASGEPSYILRDYLYCLGLNDLFVEFYGPDLINVYKTNSVYYHKIIEDTGLDPSYCIVIDDKPNLIEEAISVGMKGIVSNFDIPPRKLNLPSVSNANELSSVIQEVIKSD